jgi:hypothetical protein
MRIFLDRSPNQRERYEESRYQYRLEAANLIARFFGLRVTSGIRYGNGSSGHDKAFGALGFDFGGDDKREVALCKWAATHPELFQEVIFHDPPHAHLLFVANLNRPVDKVEEALQENGKRFRDAA